MILKIFFNTVQLTYPFDYGYEFFENNLPDFDSFIQPIFTEEMYSDVYKKVENSDSESFKKAVSSMKNYGNTQIDKVKNKISNAKVNEKIKPTKIVKSTVKAPKEPAITIKNNRKKPIKEDSSSEEEIVKKKKSKMKIPFLSSFDMSQIMTFIVFVGIFIVSSVICISIFFYFYNGYRKTEDQSNMADHYRALTRPRIEPDNEDENIRRTIRYG